MESLIDTIKDTQRKNWAYNDINDAFEQLVGIVLTYGREVSPRGMKTYEVSNVAYEYPWPEKLQYTFNNPVRKLPPAYHLVELFYYLNGRNDGLRGEYIKNAEDYANPLTGRHDGSYGLAFYYGLPYVIAQLQKDPDTRRAVISTMRTPEHIMNPESRDVPCNDLFGWRIRDGALDMNVVTRSQDLYIGWFFNTLGFQLLHLMMAKALSLQVGTYGHYIMSLHLYEKDSLKAKQSIGMTEMDTRKPELVDYSPKKFWNTITLMNSVMEFPELHGQQFDGFDDDIATAIKMSRLRHKEFEPVGVYSRWVKKWLEEKKPKTRTALGGVPIVDGKEIDDK